MSSESLSAVYPITPDGNIQTESDRHAFLDWIRFFCLVLLFVFHVARIFDGLGFYVEASSPSQVALIFGQLTLPWHMPLLFVVSGAVTAVLLGRKSRAEFFKERMKRLAIPLIAGLPLLAFPQTVIALKFRNPAWSWSQAWGEAGSAFLTITDLTGFRGGFTPAHLWFLFALILLSATALVAGRWFSRRAPTIHSSTAKQALTIGTLIAGAGLARSVINAEPFNPIIFGIYFYLGFALAKASFSSPILSARALLTGTLLLTGGAVVRALSLDAKAMYHELFLGGAFGMSMVLWTLAFTKRWLSVSRSWLRPVNESVMPIYLLHQLFIVLVGYFIVGLGSIAAEFLTILAGSLAATLAVYILVVRRFNAIRWLFGMSPAKLGRTAPSGSTP